MPRDHRAGSFNRDLPEQLRQPPTGGFFILGTFNNRSTTRVNAAEGTNIFWANRSQSTVFSLHILISLRRMGDVEPTISSNYSVWSIAMAWKHPQLQNARAIWLRDTEGSALRADHSHVAQT
jgi:hypothetical protein